MKEYLPIIYLSVLLSVLAVAAGAVFRQVLKTRKIETTLARLENKLTKEKGTPPEYYELGSIYLDKKMYSQAIMLYQKGLKAGDVEDENLAMLYNGLGFAYFAQEQYDPAIRNYKEAIKLNPEYITGLNNLGHAYERKKLTFQAIEVYEQALNYDPNNETAKGRVESLRKRVVTPSSS